MATAVSATSRLQLALRTAASSLLLAGSLLLLASTETPLNLVEPGPVTATAPVIEVSGPGVVSSPQSATTDGFHFLTIAFRPATVADLVATIFDPYSYVAPPDAFAFPGESPADAAARQRHMMEQSQFAATYAALYTAGVVDLPPVVVASVDPAGPSAGALMEGDVVLAVNGTPTPTPASVAEVVSALKPGTKAAFEVLRDGDPVSVEVDTAADFAAPDVARAGIVVAAPPPAELPYEVVFLLDGVGGPSAGLMFALEILDRLDSADLLGGRVVVGTGAIRPNGEVEPIGGVSQKIAAAVELDPDVILVPEANYDEALATVESLGFDSSRLHAVATLAGARDLLAAKASSAG